VLGAVGRRIRNTTRTRGRRKKSDKGKKAQLRSARAVQEQNLPSHSDWAGSHRAPP